jgi:hypothetical protein
MSFGPISLLDACFKSSKYIQYFSGLRPTFDNQSSGKFRNVGKLAAALPVGRSSKSEDWTLNQNLIFETTSISHLNSGVALENLIE